MAQMNTAFVIVDKDWFDVAIDPLVTGEPSKSKSGVHMLIGPADVSDHRGVWLKDFKSRNIASKDGAAVTIDILVPWQHVVAVGVTKDGTLAPTGFSGSVLRADGSTS